MSDTGHFRTIVIVAGSVTMSWGERCIDRGSSGQLMIELAISVVLGIVIILLEVFE